MTEQEPPSRQRVPEATLPPADLAAVHQVLIEIRDELRQLTARNVGPVPDRPPPPDWLPGVTLDHGPADDPVTEAVAASTGRPAGAPILKAAALANQETGPQPEKRRVVLAGRVGAAPAFRTTPTGQTIAQFPLGVHPQPDVTEWHTVLAFGERAEQLRGRLKKGEPVEVIGYVHTRNVRGKDGKSRTVEEVYASGVKRVAQ